MSKRPLVPEAKGALDKFKIGGLMTKKMVEDFEQKLVDK